MVKIEDFELFDKAAAKHITLPHHTGRIFIVGDIHGCYDELCDLLDKYRQSDDILILAGDLVHLSCLFASDRAVFTSRLIHRYRSTKAQSL
jgi:Icc-related predicted phosphoesterase